jgi:hypothetical protein
MPEYQLIRRVKLREEADIPDSLGLRRARTSLDQVNSRLPLRSASIPIALVGGVAHDLRN